MTDPSEPATTNEKLGSPPPLPPWAGRCCVRHAGPGPGGSGPGRTTPRERSAALTTAAETYLAAQRSANTTCTYGTAGDCGRTTPPQSVSLLSRGLSGPWWGSCAGSSYTTTPPSTVESRLTGVVVGLRGYGVPVSPALRPVDRWDHPRPSRGLSANTVRAISTHAEERAEPTGPDAIASKFRSVDHNRSPV